MRFHSCFLLVAETEQGVALAILRGVLDFKREPWPQISDNAKSLVRKMLEPDPKKRLTAKQVLGKYLASVVETATMMLLLVSFWGACGLLMLLCM